MPRNRLDPFSEAAARGQKMFGVLASDGAGANPAFGTPMASVQWQTLASVSMDMRSKATPVVVSVEVGDANTTAVGWGEQEEPFYVAPDFSAAAGGVDLSLEYPRQGALRFSYGAYGQRKTRIIDMRGGQYQLPPCHSVKVEAKFYNATPADTYGPTYTLRAGISPGLTTQPSIAMVSGRYEYAGAPESKIMGLLAGGYGFRFAKVSPGAVDLQVETGAVQPTIVADYNVPSYTPQIPDLVNQTGQMSVGLSGAATTFIWLANLIGF